MSMQRLLVAAALGIYGTVSMAQENPTMKVTDKYVVHRTEVPQLIVRSWERNGEFTSAWPGEKKEVPYDAAEIHLRRFAYPGIDIREIFLPTDTRTSNHQGYEDIVFYQLDGERVQFVEGASRHTSPGDVAFHPSGAYHYTVQITGGTFVEFALQRPKIEGHAIWIPQFDVRLLDTAEWMENGKLVVAQTKALAAAPAAASKYKVRAFYVPGYRFLEYHLPKGAKLPERASVTDDLFYVVQGALKVSVGGTKAEVVSGDTMRAPAGKPYSFEASEGTVLTMIHIPPVTAIAEKKGPG